MKGLARLSGLSIALRVARVALGIGSSVLLARLLPVDQYGIFAYALVIATLLAIPGEAGMPNLVTREVARARVDEDLPRLRGMVIFANATVLAFTLAMAAVTAVALWLARGSIPEALRWTLLAALPALLFGALANTRSGVQRALGEPIAAQVPEQVVRPAALILLTLAIWAVAGGRLDPVRAMSGYALASVAAFAIGALLLGRTWRTAVGAGPARFRTRAWLLALLPFSAIAGLQVAAVQMSAFVLGLVASPHEVAVFRIATVTSDFAPFALFAINALLAPQFAAHFHRGEAAELQQLVGRANLLNLALTLAVTLALAALGPSGLAFAFGEPYRASYPAMCILAGGHLLGASIGFAATLANMAGKEGMTLAAAGLGVAVNAALSLLLAPRYGATGAAVAAAATAVVWRLALAGWLYRSLRVRAWAISSDFGSLLALLARGNGVTR